MSYRGLCELVQARGWLLVLASENAGANMLAKDDPATLYRLAIYEHRQARRESTPIISVRLDDPPISLDEAANAIGTALHSAGVF